MQALPRAAVELALERGRVVVGVEADARRADATVPPGPDVDRGLGRHGVDGPGADGLAGVHVAGGVRGADAEAVRSLGKGAERARRRARLPGAVSSLHSNVEPVSLDEKANEAAAEAVGPLGPEPIVVSGATVSTVQVRLASLASVLPASSVARTRKVCSPCASPASARGDVQVCQAPASSLALERRRRAPRRSRSSRPADAVGPLGPESIVVSGATVSTVQVRTASVGSMLPAVVGGAHAEGVLALARPRGLRRGAGCERGAVELALERRAGLAGRERRSSPRPMRSAGGPA